MALPASLSTLTVKGTYVDLSGAPITQGTVSFSPPQGAFLKATDVDVIIVPKTLVASLDQNGQFTMVLPVTDDPDVVPSFTYQVDEALGTLKRTYNVEIPSALLPGPVDLSDLAPVGTVTVGTTALTKSLADQLYEPLGGGAVASVNQILPDTNGDITLTAEDVNADVAGTAAAAQAYAIDRTHHTGVQPSSTISDFTEAAQDAIAALLQGANGLTLSYDDTANTLTITGASNVDPEAVRDIMGIAMVGAGLINIAVNDAADTITISTTATQNSTDAALRDRATHTGFQEISTVTGLQTALDGKEPTYVRYATMTDATTAKNAGQIVNGQDFLIVDPTS